MLVGLTGKKRAGKDTVAARLVEEHGFVRVAFADVLKEAAYKADPIIYADDETTSYGLAEFVRDSGWESAKEHPEVRGFLQRLGLAMREAVSESIWTDAVNDKVIDLLASGKSVVITDVRFPNELDLVASLGGVHVHVDRPGLVSSDPHPSETALEPYYDLASITITNDGTLGELAATTDEVVEVARAYAGEGVSA